MIHNSDTLCWSVLSLDDTPMLVEFYRSFKMNATATTLIMVIGIGILLAMAIYFGSGYPPER